MTFGTDKAMPTRKDKAKSRLERVNSQDLQPLYEKPQVKISAIRATIIWYLLAYFLSELIAQCSICVSSALGSKEKAIEKMFVKSF